MKAIATKQPGNSKDSINDIQTGLCDIQCKAHFLHTAIINVIDGVGFSPKDLEGVALILKSIEWDIQAQNEALDDIKG